jgi:adenylate kinase
MVDNRNLVIDPTLKHTILLGQTLTLHTMGKGDLKTKKGKRAAGSTGKSRPAKRKTRVAAAKKATAKKAAKKAAPKKAAKKAAPKKAAKKAAPKKATKAAAKKK